MKARKTYPQHTIQASTGELTLASVGNASFRPARQLEAGRPAEDVVLPDGDVFLAALDESNWLLWRWARRGREGKPTKLPIEPSFGIGPVDRLRRHAWTSRGSTRRCRVCWRRGVAATASATCHARRRPARWSASTSTGASAPEALKEKRAFAEAVLELDETWCEVSPSGTGMRVLAVRDPDETPLQVEAGGYGLFETGGKFFTISFDPVSRCREVRPAPKTRALLLEAYGRARALNARRIDRKGAGRLTPPVIDLKGSSTRRMAARTVKEGPEEHGCSARAWANGAPPNPALNRRGDVSSGIGALILFVALLSLGHVMLAVTAGLLHALGKFGSAWKWRPLPGLRATWPDCFRTMVLASRVPAILASSLDLAHAVATADAAAPATAWLIPLTLLICYAIWCKADLMLFRASKPAAQPA